MSKRHRVVILLSGVAFAAFAAFAGPAAPGRADAGESYQTCDGAVCLVMGEDDPATWEYGGFRPFITDWKGDQAYLVQVTQDGGSTVQAGSYSINVDDFWTPMLSNSLYRYGDFTPTAAGAGLDLGVFADLTGTTVYNTSYLGGLLTQLSIYDPDGSNYMVFSTGLFTNTLVNSAVAGKSADFIQFGDSDPIFLWNSMDDSSFPQVPAYLLPADPWAGIDFNPDNFALADVSAF